MSPEQPPSLIVEPAVPDKFCSWCRTTHPVTAFPMATGRGRSWRRSWCRDAMKAYYALRYQREKELRRARLIAAIEDQGAKGVAS